MALEQINNGDNLGVVRSKMNLAIAGSAEKSTSMPTVGQLNPVSYDMYKIGGREIVRKDTALKVLIIGSSQGTGAGATSYENSWAGKLEVDLQSKGFITKNVSIGGYNSQQNIDRWMNDVISWNPDIIIECSALWNEGFYNADSNIRRFTMQTRLKNMGKMIMLCKKTGIVFLHGFILYYGQAGSFINTSFVSEMRQYIDAMSPYLIGNSSGVSDGIGMWSAFNSGDWIHNNNAGYQELFNSINIERITNLSQFTEFKIDKNATGITYTNSGQDGLLLNSDRAINSFTIGFKCKMLNDATVVFLNVIGSTFRLRKNSSNSINLADDTTGQVITYTAPSTIVDLGEFECVLSVNLSKPLTKLYINGVKAGETTYTPSFSNITQILFGNRRSGTFPMNGSVMKNLVVYRCELSEYECSNLFKKPLNYGSLIYYNDLSESVPQFGYYPNKACSTVTLYREFI